MDGLQVRDWSLDITETLAKEESAFLGFTSIVFLLTTAIAMVWETGTERLVPRLWHYLGR